MIIFAAARVEGSRRGRKNRKTRGKALRRIGREKRGRSSRMNNECERLVIKLCNWWCKQRKLLTRCVLYVAGLCLGIQDRRPRLADWLLDKPSQAEPRQARPIQAKPSRAEPSQASQAQPSQAKPGQASQAQPSQAKRDLVRCGGVSDKSAAGGDWCWAERTRVGLGYISLEGYS